MLEKIIKSCKYLLNNFQEAQEVKNYLDNRLNKESQDLFDFGYFPSINNINVLQELLDNNLLEDLNLLYSKEIDDAFYPRTLLFSYFENYPLIMPFKDHYGNTIGIVGRTLASENERRAKNISKYKNTKFTKGNYLFGLYENKKHIIENNCVYIVEGQFDVIKANEKGLKNIVAIGSGNMSMNQFALICRYTDNIFLLLDNDEAGIKGRKKIISKFSKLANIRNMYLPDEYKDIDEFFSKKDLQDLEFIIKD